MWLNKGKKSLSTPLRHIRHLRKAYGSIPLDGDNWSVSYLVASKMEKETSLYI